MTWKCRVLAAAFISAAVSQAAAEIVPPDKVVSEDHKVMASLTDMPGNAEEGAKVFRDASLGNCLACHVNSKLPNDLFQGEIGPALDGVADRWSPEEMRAILVNSKDVFGEQTIMPGFYSLKVGADVRKDLVGKTILSAEEVEDVIAYLSTLKE